jgi:hypothetical protein
VCVVFRNGSIHFYHVTFANMGLMGHSAHAECQARCETASINVVVRVFLSDTHQKNVISIAANVSFSGCN